MPITTLHKQKFKTNMAILGAIAAWSALLFIVAIVKMSGN